MNDNFDLDIDNYRINQLQLLFKLPKDFKEDHLKKRPSPNQHLKRKNGSHIRPPSQATRWKFIKIDDFKHILK